MLGKGVHISVQYLHLVKIDTLITQPFMSCGPDGIMAGQQRGAADNATMTWGWLGLCLQHLSQNIKPIPIWLYFSEEYTIISIWYWYTYTCSYDLGYEQCYMKKIIAGLILITVTLFRLKTYFALLNNNLFAFKNIYMDMIQHYQIYLNFQWYCI